MNANEYNACVKRQKRYLGYQFSKKRMTEVTQSPINSPRKLIALIPDTDLSRVVAETFQLAKFEPKILDLIESDQDRLALEKKEIRVKDKSWKKAQGGRLPGFDDAEERINDL